MKPIPYLCTLSAVFIMLTAGCSITAHNKHSELNLVTINTAPGFGHVLIDGELHQLPETFKIRDINNTPLIFSKSDYITRQLTFQFDGGDFDVVDEGDISGIKIYPSTRTTPYGISVQISRK